MKRNHQAAVLAGLTVLGIGIISPATAETITVTRGPNFAAHQVKADKVPSDAQALEKAPGTSVPKVVTHGPNGAAQIAQSTSASKTTAQLSGHPKVISRGPNGAAHIVN